MEEVPLGGASAPDEFIRLHEIAVEIGNELAGLRVDPHGRGPETLVLALNRRRGQLFGDDAAEGLADDAGEDRLQVVSEAGAVNQRLLFFFDNSNTKFNKSIYYRVL